MFGVLAWPVRRPESLLMSAIYRNHPRFADETFPVWYGDRDFDTFPATIEGGDVLVVEERTVTRLFEDLERELAGADVLRVLDRQWLSGADDELRRGLGSLIDRFRARGGEVEPADAGG